MDTRSAIQDLISSYLTSQTQMSKSFEAMGIDPKVARTVAPLDDNENPETPKNVKATSFLKAVQVSWDAPPDTDAVSTYEVEVTPTAGASYIVEGKGWGLSHSFHNLPYNSHSFRVRFTDKFHRKSVWSASKSAAPTQSAEYTIDLTKAKILGTLQGQLPNENIATIEDATKLGKGIVLAETMAVQNAAAMRLWVGEGAIERAFLKDAIIDEAKVANASITTSKIVNLSVTSAKIDSLAVDKLTAGTFTSGDIVIAGNGRLRAGNVRLDSGGIDLPPVNNYQYSSDNRSWKIGSTNNMSSLYFLSTSDGNAGILQGDRGRGKPGMGLLAGIANPNELLAPANATLRAVSTIGADNPSFISANAQQIELVTDTLFVKGEPVFLKTHRSNKRGYIGIASNSNYWFWLWVTDNGDLRCTANRPHE